MAVHRRTKSFKEILRRTDPLIGLWSGLASALGAELLAEGGFDWIVLDAEHAPIDVPSMLTLLQAMKATDTAPLVRVPWNDAVAIKRFLDIGADALLVPFVETEEEASEAVRAMLYPPHGVRGVASRHRAGRYGRRRDYMAAANGELCLVVQVESKRALANLRGIAGVTGIDGIFIGPSDLAASLGHLGNPNHPEVREQIANALRVCLDLGVPAGILAPDLTLAVQYAEAGFRFVAVGTDVGLLVDAADRLVADVKRTLEAQ